MVKSMAIEVAPKGVRANMVSPGTILEDGNTWGRQRDAGTERYKRMLARNPDGPHGHAAGSGGAVVFLAGTPASFVSGINMIVDGAIDGAGAVLSAAHALAAGRPAGRGRHGGRVPCRQGAAVDSVDPRGAGREPAPGRLAAVDHQPDHGAGRHGDRAHRRPLRPSPAGPARHRRSASLASLLGAFAGSVEPCWSARVFEGLGFIAVVGRPPDAAAAHRHAGRSAARHDVLDDLHAGRRRHDDADRGHRPARHLVAHRLAGRLRRLRRSCCSPCCCARCRGANSIRCRPAAGRCCTKWRRWRPAAGRSPSRSASAPMPAAGSPSSASCRPCRSSGWASRPRPRPSSRRWSPS